MMTIEDDNIRLDLDWIMRKCTGREKNQKKKTKTNGIWDDDFIYIKKQKISILIYMYFNYQRIGENV